MNQQSFLKVGNPNSLGWVGLEVFAVLMLLSITILLGANMAGNEIDVLPLAKQYADPTWIPGDWYLNQPPGYRILFQTLFGWLIVSWGFLATSILGRLLCYSLASLGLVLIGRKLGLSLPLLLLATGLDMYMNGYRPLAAQLLLLGADKAKWIGYGLSLLAIGIFLAGRRLRFRLPLSFLFLAVGLFLIGDNRPYSIVGNEWLVGGLEAKAVAYGFILVAIGLMLRGCYRWMAFLLGLATSFHVLVGGYAFITVLGWLVLRWKTPLPTLQKFGFIILIYLLGSAFAVGPVLEQLFTPNPTGSLPPSYIYVFFRLPHHLNPLVWPPSWWVNLIIYLLILLLSVGLIRRYRLPGQSSEEQYLARMGLFEFTLISLVPFLLGLAIAPFDSKGSLLQYYPFRLGDVMLPITTYLLFACALEQTFTGQSRRVLIFLSLLVLSVPFSMPLVKFPQRALALRQFPSQEQDVSRDQKDFCNWVKRNTPKDVIVVSPPAKFANFTWLAERPTIAKFKLLPQGKAGILEWYERLTDLSGDASVWSIATDKGVNVFSDITGRLSNGYNHLTTPQAEALMIKYKADYFATSVKHRLDLPVVYRNQSYILYKKSG